MNFIDRRRLARNRKSDEIAFLPVLTLMPHSRCNCRCVMCDIWRANKAGRELSADQLAPHIADIKKLGVRQIVLSGGEALMHASLWSLCALIRPLGAKITLLSTGLLLARHAPGIGRWCDEVIVSLDGDATRHDAIRNIPRAFERLAEGVAALKAEAPGLPVGARCVVQKANFDRLPEVIEAGRDMGLDSISFLAADVSSEAFNRQGGWPVERAGAVALAADDVGRLKQSIEDIIERHADDIASGFIVEGADKLRRIPAYFAALLGDGSFPPVRCNAPWVSAVIEADGAVRPCFFHPPYGTLGDEGLAAVLNQAGARRFRRGLDVDRDPVCRKCVCSLHLS